jgi:hypothetical protein
LFLVYSFSKTIAQSGFMMIPPLSLPFGGQIRRINTTNFERFSQEQSRPSKHRSLSKHNNKNQQTLTVDIQS